MSQNEVDHAVHLLARQSLRPFFDFKWCGGIMAQEVNSEQLCGSLRVEFSCGLLLLQLAPERESDLEQQGVLETNAPGQSETSGIGAR